MAVVDLTGKLFGRLTVLKRVKMLGNKPSYKQAHWLCRCTCGTDVIVQSWTLKSGRAQSCGCLHREVVSTHGETVFIDGKQLLTKEYNAWIAMKQRCYNSNKDNFVNYGGRGIRVCRRWLGVHGYENFLEDMGRSPSPEHSIDRKNNDGNYTPLNCRWATREQQQNNQRRSQKGRVFKSGT